jgi:hypothetical protein
MATHQNFELKSEENRVVDGNLLTGFSLLFIQPFQNLQHFSVLFFVSFGREANRRKLASKRQQNARKTCQVSNG